MRFILSCNSIASFGLFVSRPARRLVTMALVLLSLPTPALSAPVTSTQTGDANCDETITAADVPGLVALLSSDTPARCGEDVNQNGEVDQGDVEPLIDDIFEQPGTNTIAVIPPTGGSVGVETTDHLILVVTVPSGALLEPTTIALRAVEAPTGLIARFAIDPPELSLLAPATFTVTLPPGAPFDETLALSFESDHVVHFPTEIDFEARTLTATIYQYGFSPSEVTAGGAAGSEDSFFDVGRAECDFLRDSLADAILRAQAFNGALPPSLASPLITQYRAALFACQGSLAEATAAMQEVACSNKTSAETQAQVVLVESVADFKRNVGALLAAEGLVREVGANCSVAFSILEAEFAEYIQSYVARINAPGFIANFPTWDALWNEIIPCLDVLAVADEFASSARSMIVSELLPALFARLREVAINACENDENNALVGDILSGGHLLNHPIGPTADLPDFSGLTQEELLFQFHRCGSSLVLQTKSAQGAVTSMVTVGTGGSTTATINVDDNGFISVDSRLLPLKCGQILARDEVQVIAEIPSHLPAADLGSLGAGRTIDVSATLARLPLGSTASAFDLLFQRQRSQCGLSNGGKPTIDLYRVSVRVRRGCAAGGCHRPTPSPTIDPGCVVCF